MFFHYRFPNQTADNAGNETADDHCRKNPSGSQCTMYCIYVSIAIGDRCLRKPIFAGRNPVDVVSADAGR